MRKYYEPKIIEKLKNETVIAYGCISTTTINNSNKKEAYKKTKAFQDVQETLKNFFIPKDNVLIDIISPKNRIRECFEDMIYTFIHNDNFDTDEPKGSFVISSIVDLGTTAGEIIDNYKLLLENNIGLLVYSDEKLSTVDFRFKYTYKYGPEQIFERILQLPIDSFYRKGRKKEKLEVTDNFKELYWLYENYDIEEKNTYNNHINGKITKVKFNQLCDLYESSPDYSKDELEQENRNKISEKPKRHGAIPKYYDTLTHLLEAGESLDDACTKLNIDPAISDLTYKRFSIKNRSSMGKATHKYRNDKLNKIITEYQNSTQ